MTPCEALDGEVYSNPYGEDDIENFIQQFIILEEQQQQQFVQICETKWEYPLRMTGQDIIAAMPEIAQLIVG